MLQRLVNDAPTDVANIVFRMKHEMDFSEVLTNLLDYDWFIRQIELAFQAHARDGLILVQQFSEGTVGQNITILSRITGEEVDEIGYAWTSYNHDQLQVLDAWARRNGDIGWTEEDWSEHYGTWKEDLGNGLVKIRLMIRDLPSLPEFNVLEHHTFYTHFPGFLPIEVIIPSNCVYSVVVPLDQAQIAVKYNFEEDIVFAREKVQAMALANDRAERNQIVTELLEFFIIKPTMLVHSYKMRHSVYCKMEEFMVWIYKCNDIKYVNYIRGLVDRLSTVLSMVLEDPLCVK